MSFGVIGRLPRIVPEPGAVFNGVSIPAGVSYFFPVIYCHRLRLSVYLTP
jgi:hypothetical protein